MNKIIENIFEIILSTLLVSFLLFILFASKINGKDGIFNALSENGYNNKKDYVNQEMTPEAAKEIQKEELKVSQDIALQYIGGAEKNTFNEINEDNLLIWNNINDFRKMFIVTYNDKFYRFKNNEWLVADSISGVYSIQNEVAFTFYINDVRTVDGKEVDYVQCSINEVEGETYPTVVYDQNKNELYCMISGICKFNLKVTEIYSGANARRIISVPFVPQKG